MTISNHLLSAYTPLALTADAAALKTILAVLDPKTVDRPATTALVHTLHGRGNPDAVRLADAIEAAERDGGAPAEVLDAIKQAHARARERLGTTSAPDEGLSPRVGTLHPPGALDLAPDGTPVWTDEGGTRRTMAGWLCEQAGGGCGVLSGGVTVTGRDGRVEALTGAQCERLAESVSYLHIDAEPDDPRPALRHAVLVGCGRADVAHAEASLRHAHRAIRLGREQGGVTRAWADTLGDGICEATRRGSPVHRLDPARITRAMEMHASTGPEAE